MTDLAHSKSEVREVGDKVLFEYHCRESHDSSDAKLWYRSQQPVIIIGPATLQDVDVHPDKDSELLDLIGHTRKQRMENADVLVYSIRFKDGHEADVFEDELLDSTDEYEREAPPAMKVAA
jgi:hypothetical protein